MPRRLLRPGRDPGHRGDGAQVVEGHGQDALVDDAAHLLAGEVVEAAADVADGAGGVELGPLGGAEGERVQQRPRGADAGRADADDGHVGPLGRVQRVGDGLLAQQQGEGLGRAEQGRGVQVAVAGPDALGQLPDQLLAGDGRVEGREAAHQLDDLDVAAGQVDGPDHRLQAVAPGERHHLAVAQRLVQPAGGQVADPAQHLGLRADLEDPGVGQPVAARAGPARARGRAGPGPRSGSRRCRGRGPA